MTTINNIGSNIPHNRNTVDQTENTSKGLGLSANAKEVVNQALSILGNAGIKIQNLASRPDSTGTTTGATGTPALDEPGDKKNVAANLEKLISYLQLENEEQQTELAKERIELNKYSLETEHQDRSEKIQESLDDMDKAYRSSKASKIFGWIMTALAVIGAVVACVATGGLATGAVIAAGIALTTQILSETGAMEKITDALSEGLQSLGMSKEAADIVSQVAVTVVIVAASIAAGNLGSLGSNVSQAIKDVMAVVQPIMKLATAVMGVGSVVTSGVASYDSYKSGMSQADTTESEKYLQMLSQRLEESEEELQEILEMMQNFIGQLADMIGSSTDTSAEIAQQMGQMA